MSEQLDRMESTVTYQLTRASVAGPVTVGRRVDIGSVIDRLLRALRTAYVDRNIDVELQLETGLTVRVILSQKSYEPLLSRMASSQQPNCSMTQTSRLLLWASNFSKAKMSV